MHVASKSTVVRGGILTASMVEGLAATLTNSGVVNTFQTDIPIAAAAASGVNRVYIVAAAPDDFPRPVDLRQYRAGWNVQLDRDSGDFAEPFETITRYNVGISNLDNPTIPSGFMVNLHRGGTYTVPAACFVEVAGIKVPGNYIEVGNDSKWQYTASRTNAVGEVRFYNEATDELTFDLWA